MYLIVICSPIFTSELLSSIFRNISLLLALDISSETLIVISSVRYIFLPTLTSRFGILISPVFFGIILHDIDRELDFFPLINLRNSKYQKDDSPLDIKCKNFNLNKYSKNYLNHLFNTNEILASMLLTLHNINFYQELMASIRKNINDGTFDQFHDKYIDKL